MLFTNPFKCGLCLQRKRSPPLLTPFPNLTLPPPLPLMAQPLHLHLLSMVPLPPFPPQQMTPPLVRCLVPQLQLALMQQKPTTTTSNRWNCSMIYHRVSESALCTSHKWRNAKKLFQIWSKTIHFCHLLHFLSYSFIAFLTFDCSKLIKERFSNSYYIFIYCIYSFYLGIHNSVCAILISWNEQISEKALWNSLPVM